MKKNRKRIFLITAAAAGAAGLARSIQKKKIDPQSAAKRAYRVVNLNVNEGEDYCNGVALTPPMGWSSWNTFRNNIDENLILETANAMKESGLLEAGYRYINLDDCWQSSLRDEKGRLQGDFVKFPNGIKALVEKINALGLKTGIYSSNGRLTCEDLPASLGNEAIDALTFAEWGIEYFKYDFCHNVPIPSRAPYIETVTISKAGSAEEIILPADSAVLTGSARIVSDDKLITGQYIAGLCAGGGTAEFNVEVTTAGEYILTLNIRKKSYSHKYCEIKINDAEVYTATLPPTLAWTKQGRHQLKVKLAKGENTIKIYNPVTSRQYSAAKQYIRMGQELKKATKAVAEKTGLPEKPIVYSICEWGMNFPWKWGRKAGNLWRTTHDIKAFWASILAIYEINVRLFKNSGPGSWNDPDMLEVGNGNLTYDENVAHFSLWCMMAAPLILGNDIRQFLNEDGKKDTENEILKIVSDADMIAINQDHLGIQCRRLKTNGLCDTLVKPLQDDELALCFFNKSGEEKVFEQDMQDLVSQLFVNLPYAEQYELYDVWDKTTEKVNKTVYAIVPPHGVKVFRIKAVQ